MKFVQVNERAITPNNFLLNENARNRPSIPIARDNAITDREDAFDPDGTKETIVRVTSKIRQALAASRQNLETLQTNASSRRMQRTQRIVVLDPTANPKRLTEIRKLFRERSPSGNLQIFHHFFMGILARRILRVSRNIKT